MIVDAADFQDSLDAVVTWATSIAPGLLVFVAALAGVRYSIKTLKRVITGA